MPLPFENRTQAAEALALRLHDYRGRNPLILAIPRGGVPMGKIIAERLEGELDVVLVHKLGSPFNPEFAIGAVDETGATYPAPSAIWFHVTRSCVAHEKARQLALLKERRARYTPVRPPIDPAGRIVIVVDDGLATGATMKAALHAVRCRRPAELVCAVPVAAPQCLAQLMPLERFQPDCAVDPGRFARGTALRLLAMARHVASTRLVPQANRLGLASHSQAESALAAGSAQRVK
jgi:putative phosphoribosyl transferase